MGCSQSPKIENGSNSKKNNKKGTISKQKEVKDSENLSLSKQPEVKEDENISLSKQEDVKDGENISLSNNKILPEKTEQSSSKIKKLGNGNINICNFNKIDLFISMEDDPLQKYNYFKIGFNKCNYMFIVPDHFSNLFSSFYSKILKNTLIFFPKDFQQTKELLNDYENEEGNKENWIIISPCIELEENIQTLNENKNIYCFIGYCPIFNHEHNCDLLFQFSKYFGMVDSCSELLEKLFKLSNIFYYRKKQKYEINNDMNNIIELKYDTKFLMDFNNE